MNNINFALLASLYNGKSNLYKEIYFPIIKFALILCLKESEDKCTSSIDELHSKINQEFGVLIPRVVIKKAIKYLIKVNNAFQVSLDRDNLKIRKADMTLLDDVYNKEAVVSASLQRLEQSYIDYFRGQDIIPEKTFVEFFSAQIQEVLRYLNDKDNEGVERSLNEEYTHNVTYLEWLSKNDCELYESANKILWGATVAGFLVRDDYEFDVNLISGCRYYLDTAIVMGCLDLSYEKTTKYSQELVRVIKFSNSKACIHPITLNEIKQIIRGVEMDGCPRCGTPINEAFERRALTCTKLADIRINLESLIQEVGIEIFSETKDVVEIQKEYRGKSIVKKLGERRSGMVVADNNPRDIHDAYMIDFVRRVRGKDSIREKIKAYFVTMNADLVKFSVEYYSSSINALIEPSSVVLDLWLHGANLQSQVGQLSLTETMSRCLAFNEQSATTKIRQIFAYYDNEEMNDPRVRQEIVTGIMVRSNKYLLSEDDNNQSNYNSSIVASRLYKQAEQDIKQRDQSVVEMQNLREENTRVSTKNESLEAKLNEIEEKEQSRRNLKEERKKVQEDLAKLSTQRRRAMSWIYFELAIEIVVNVLVLVLFIFFPIKIAPFISVWKPDLKPVLEEANLGKCLVAWLLVVGCLYTVLHGKSRIFALKKFQKAWDDEHPLYNQKNDKLKEIERKLEEL